MTTMRDTADLATGGRTAMSVSVAICNLQSLRMQRLATFALLICVISYKSAAMDLYANIDKPVPVEKVDFIRNLIPFLRGVKIDKMRYFDPPGFAMFIRLEDEQFCDYVGNCLNFVINNSSSDPNYLSVFAKSTVILTPAMRTLGKEGEGMNGSIVSFLVGGSAAREFRVFINQDIIAVVP